MRQKVLETLLEFAWFHEKFSVKQAPEGHLVTPKDGFEHALTMQGRSPLECRALVGEGNLLYWSLVDRFAVQGRGMGVHEQLDARRDLEEDFLKEWRVERSLSVAPKSEKGLKEFQSQLDSSMMDWDWNIQLMVMSKINLKNFLQFAEESGEFHALLFTIRDKQYGEIECYVTYEDEEFEISLLAEPEVDDVDEHCIAVLNKLTGKRTARSVEL